MSPTRIVVYACAALASAPAVAGTNLAAPFALSIPTLDEIGLAALIALVGGVAGYFARKRTRR